MIWGMCAVEHRGSQQPAEKECTESFQLRRSSTALEAVRELARHTQHTFTHQEAGAGEEAAAMQVQVVVIVWGLVGLGVEGAEAGLHTHAQKMRGARRHGA